jgi:hypothetical protein
VRPDTRRDGPRVTRVTGKLELAACAAPYPCLVALRRAVLAQEELEGMSDARAWRSASIGERPGYLECATIWNDSTSGTKVIVQTDGASE